MTRLNLGSGAHPLEGFVNLTPPGWRFQDGLGDYPDGSVEGITISHALMHLPLADWPAAFAEFARVLEQRGVLRVTEDATDDPASERYGGFPGAVTLTSSALVVTHMELAGLHAGTEPAGATRFRDSSLIQEHHGNPPKVFHAEGVKGDASQAERASAYERLGFPEQSASAGYGVGGGGQGEGIGGSDRGQGFR